MSQQSRMYSSSPRSQSWLMTSGLGLCTTPHCLTRGGTHMYVKESNYYTRCGAIKWRKVHHEHVLPDPVVPIQGLRVGSGGFQNNCWKFVLSSSPWLPTNWLFSADLDSNPNHPSGDSNRNPSRDSATFSKLVFLLMFPSSCPLINVWNVPFHV